MTAVCGAWLTRAKIGIVLARLGNGTWASIKLDD